MRTEHSAPVVDQVQALSRAEVQPAWTQSALTCRMAHRLSVLTSDIPRAVLRARTLALCGTGVHFLTLVLLHDARHCA